MFLKNIVLLELFFFEAALKCLVKNLLDILRVKIWFFRGINQYYHILISCYWLRMLGWNSQKYLSLKFWLESYFQPIIFSYCRLKLNLDLSIFENFSPGILNVVSKYSWIVAVYTHLPKDPTAVRFKVCEHNDMSWHRLPYFSSVVTFQCFDFVYMYLRWSTIDTDK